MTLTYQFPEPRFPNRRTGSDKIYWPFGSSMERWVARTREIEWTCTVDRSFRWLHPADGAVKMPGLLSIAFDDGIREMLGRRILGFRSPLRGRLRVGQEEEEKRKTKKESRRRSRVVEDRDDARVRGKALGIHRRRIGGR